MQLIRACALAAVMGAAPSPGHADGRAATWISVYTDDDRLTVISPQLSVRDRVREDVELSAAYDVDIISAATVDVITAGSPRGYEERRHGLRLGARWEQAPGTSLSLNYLPSWEPDYRSHALAGQIAKEWIDRRLTTRIDARIIMDRVGRTGDDPSRWRDLTTPVAAASVSWIFDPRSVGELAYELQVPSGFQASPYRYVTIGWSGGAEISVPEAVPRRRVRHALSAGARRAVADSVFVWAAYRFYADSWSIKSHTLEIELQRTFAGDRVIAGLSARGYRQGKAAFHHESYTVPAGELPVYRSADKTLASVWSALAGARVEASYRSGSWFEVARAMAKVEIYDQHYREFAPLARRTALVLSLGASLEY